MFSQVHLWKNCLTVQDSFKFSKRLQIRFFGVHLWRPTSSPGSVQFSSVTQSCLTLQPHGLQHARPPCLSPTPRVQPNSCPSNWWCNPTISSSVVPFSSCPQAFPASGSFPVSQLFAWGGQRIGASASTSVLPTNTQDWSPCSPRDSQESYATPQFKSISFSVFSFLHSPTLTSIHDHWKNHSLD